MESLIWRITDLDPSVKEDAEILLFWEEKDGGQQLFKAQELLKTETSRSFGYVSEGLAYYLRNLKWGGGNPLEPAQEVIRLLAHKELAKPPVDSDDSDYPANHWIAIHLFSWIAQSEEDLELILSFLGTTKDKQLFNKAFEGLPHVIYKVGTAGLEVEIISLAEKLLWTSHSTGMKGKAAHILLNVGNERAYDLLWKAAVDTEMLPDTRGVILRLVLEFGEKSMQGKFRTLLTSFLDECEDQKSEVSVWTDLVGLAK